LQRAPYLAGQFLRVHLLALDRRQPFELVLRSAQSRLPPLLIPLLTPAAAGNHVALALAHNFHHLRAVPQLGRLFGGQVRQQLFQRAGAQARHILELELIHGLQIDLAAHAAIKHEDRLADAETAAQGAQQSLERGGIGAVAAQHFQM
jgi:hypothetical protein